MTGQNPQRPPQNPVRALSESTTVLDLRYRSETAFLCAYSARLSRGELFLETENPLPTGTRTTLRLRVPGAAPLDVDAAVAWTRGIAIGPGQPAGMGIALSSSIEAHGALIDELASRYARIRILVIGAAPAPRAVIGRYLRSILACDVVETTPQLVTTGPSSGPDHGLAADISKEIETGIDLGIIDLDSERATAETVIRLLKTGAATADLPIIALARFERERASAAALGADEVLTTPPLFSELKTTVIHTLSHPRFSADR